jgi:integrase
MERLVNRLSDLKVKKLKKPGRHADGNNLYLSISKPPAFGRRWVFLYRWHGKPTEIGFGSARVVTLAEARELAMEGRRLLAKGVNPKDGLRAKGGATFGDCSDKLIEAMRPSWRSEKHASQWTMTMGKYAVSIRPHPVMNITTDDVLRVLSPIWKNKPETANRLRGRIEMVLDAAKAQGLRFGDNPARWRGHLEHLLPAHDKRERGHHAAMDYAEVASFITELRAQNTTSALALEFTILTAARSGEVLGARWDEFDLDQGVWTVPAKRMKGKREHRVPLSERAQAIVRTMRELRSCEYVFAGQTGQKPIAVTGLSSLLSRMKVEGATVHGFRSTFRDWAGEVSSFPHDVCEAALAHTIGNKTERAYRRGDLFEKRRLLMSAWAAFCDTPTASKIVPLRRKA